MTRGKNLQGVRPPNRNEAAYYTDGIPAGTKTRFGWLVDDGFVDEQAVDMAVHGRNPVPDLTHTEACHVALRLQHMANMTPQQGKARVTSASVLVQARLGLTERRARALLCSVRQKQSKGELPKKVSKWL